MKDSRKLLTRPSNDLWLSIQKVEKKRYERHFEATGNYNGHFSATPSSVTRAVRDRLGAIKGSILDIGCGIFVYPDYLPRNSRVFGIDPYRGKGRDFYFSQAIGENLPFMSNSFNAVLLMSSLDHVLDPAKVMSESRRVLKPKGEIFIWFISRDRIDPHHPWCFNARELTDFMSSWFEIAESHEYNADKKIGYPRTKMLVGIRL